MPCKNIDNYLYRSHWVVQVETFFARNRHFLNIVHGIAFILFAALIAVPPFLPDYPQISILAREVIWTIWFPLVFLSVIFTGRSWCGLLCPMGAASEWMNRIGRKRPVPKWVEWPGTPIVSFLLVTIWGQLLGVRDHAEAIAWVFGTTLLAAMVTGFLFGHYKRVWCRHLCPIGLMLGVFSRLGMITFTPKRPKEGPEQISDKTACPTRIALPYKKESRHCIACYRCVSPNAKGGLSLMLRKPGTEIAAIGKSNPNLAEALFLFLGTGISLGGFMWQALPSYVRLRQWFGEQCLSIGWEWLLMPGPSWLVSVHPGRAEILLWMDALLISLYMMAWMAGAALLMAGITAAVTAVTQKTAQTLFRKRFIELSYQLIPVAMISLLTGLGSNLFAILGHELGKQPIRVIKIMLLLLSCVWGVRLCHSILLAQGVAKRRLALFIAAIGNLAVALCWWPAIAM